MEEDGEVRFLRVGLKAFRELHRFLLLNEEGDFISWSLTSVFLSGYLGFSLALITLFGTDNIMFFTRFSHDNLIHLYIPRTVIDNGLNSKLGNLGTVWLPLYHLTLLFLVPVNLLYVTGLAGSLLNALFVASSASAVYLIVGGVEGVVSAAAFGASAYSLIHSTSAYMVPEGMFLTLASLLYFRKYLEGDDTKSLVKASAFIFMASLARYESWFVLLGMWLSVILRECVRKEGKCVRISFLALSALAPLGWMAYNAVIFGNPFEFVTHPSVGASGYYGLIAYRVLHPWLTNYLNVLEDLLYLTGPFFLLALVGVVYAARKYGVAWVLVILSPFILLLSEGNELLIHDHPLYFYFLSPLTFVLAGYGIKALTHRSSGITPRLREALTALLAVLLILAYVASQAYVYGELAQDLTGVAPGEYRRAVMGVRQVLAVWRGRGFILYSSVIGSWELSVLGGLSPRALIDEFDMPLYLKVSQKPWRYGVTVVVIPSDYLSVRNALIGLGGRFNYVSLFYGDASWRSEFLKHYELKGEVGGLLIYGLRG